MPPRQPICRYSGRVRVLTALHVYNCKMTFFALFAFCFRSQNATYAPLELCTENNINILAFIFLFEPGFRI